MRVLMILVLALRRRIFFLRGGIRRGQRFDIQVSALPESSTTSLAQGDLFQTELRIYGANPADYPDHLRRLQDTLERHPNDPVLLFLQGYVLWFDDRQNDARPFFEKAAPLVPDRRDIDRFLQVK